MGIMVSEVYEAFIAAGAPESKAKAAAEAIPVTEQLATKQDIASVRQDIAGVEAMVGRVDSELKGSIVRVESELRSSIASVEAKIAAQEAKMWRAGLAVAGAAVLLNRFLDWITP